MRISLTAKVLNQTSGYAPSLRLNSRFPTATLHNIQHSIRGLNRNVAIWLNMQSRSHEATVTQRRRDVASSI